MSSIWAHLALICWFIYNMVWCVAVYWMLYPSPFHCVYVVLSYLPVCVASDVVCLWCLGLSLSSIVFLLWFSFSLDPPSSLLCTIFNILSASLSFFKNNFNMYISLFKIWGFYKQGYKCKGKRELYVCMFGMSEKITNSFTNSPIQKRSIGQRFEECITIDSCSFQFHVTLSQDLILCFNFSWFP